MLWYQIAHKELLDICIIINDGILIKWIQTKG